MKSGACSIGSLANSDVRVGVPVIVINGRFLTQPLRGVQRFAECLVQELSGLRNDLCVVAPHGELRMREIGGLPVYQWGHLSGYLWEQIELPRFLRNANSELVLCLGNTGPIGGRRMVLALHDVTYLDFPGGYPFAMRLWLKTMTPILVRRSREVITVSHTAKRQIVSHYPAAGNKIAVVSNAVSGELTGSGPETVQRHDFLAFYHASESKNCAILVEAFRALPNETLRLVGPAPESPVPPNVIPLGRLNDSQLLDEYQHALGFIIPSLSEGFGIPPLEAQANGAVVLSSNASSLPEVLADSALFFNPRDVSDLVDKIKRLAADPALVTRLRSLGSENWRRYSWKSSAERLNEVLNSLKRGS